jgi:capsid protein
MTASRLPLLDSSGLPMPSRNGHRKALAELLPRVTRRREIAATYDAASDAVDYQNHWANADAYDADSANSRAVRARLVQRSRYEVANNGYADGIAGTWATDLIGIGPALRMQTGSEGFNQLIEREWYAWTKAVKFRRKLWCLAHALHVDGEGLAVIRQNPRAGHRIRLDFRLYETEQCQTPLLSFGDANYIDGIKFDENGDPLWYDILHQHPGASNGYQFDMTPERVPARYMLHWFKLARPGQHRGIPACTSTLNVGAAARRWREATLAAAETAADFAVLLKTMFEPDELDAAEPFSTLEIQKRMMTALPNNSEPFQMKGEHPNAEYEAFHKLLINEQARPKAMPYNKAACDSSSYNYASGRLDHQTYYAALDVDREDCNDLVLDPLFDVWFDYAVTTYGWLGGDPLAISPAARSHQWDWPKHRVADVQAEASANDKQLKNATKSLAGIYTEAGQDYEDEVAKQAASNGIAPEQQKQINLLLNLPQHVLPVVAEMLGYVQPKQAADPTRGEGNAEDQKTS